MKMALICRQGVKPSPKLKKNLVKRPAANMAYNVTELKPRKVGLWCHEMWEVGNVVMHFPHVFVCTIMWHLTTEERPKSVSMATINLLLNEAESGIHNFISNNDGDLR